MRPCYKNKRFVFLDIDGVLNSFAYIHQASAHREVSCDYKYRRANPKLVWDAKRLDPVRMELLNRILSETGALVVVSSSLCKIRSRTELQEMFTLVGFTGTVCDKTGGSKDCRRGGEIIKWMADNEIEPSSCVILEDEGFDQDLTCDMLVKIPVMGGLQESHVQEAIALLEEGDS